MVIENGDPGAPGERRPVGHLQRHVLIIVQDGYTDHFVTLLTAGASRIRQLPAVRAWRPVCHFRGESESRHRLLHRAPSRRRAPFRRRRPYSRPYPVRALPMLYERPRGRDEPEYARDG